MIQRNDQSSNSEIFKDFVVEVTADGSPTARLKTEQAERTESMHNSQGAAAETVYIYTNPFRYMLQNLHRENEINSLVVGLGLGYIELNILNELLKQDKISREIQFNLLTFEKNEELRNTFRQSIEHLFNNNEKSKTTALYEQIIQFVVNQHELRATHVIEFASQTLHDQKAFDVNLNWKILEELNLQTQTDKRFHFVAYDAYSQRTDHPLWTEEFLNDFVEKFCHQNCVFSTYACTGTLKRTLIKHGFTLVKRNGFKGKREATLAFRGVFNNDPQLFQIF